jgi:hypothetical protein
MRRRAAADGPHLFANSRAAKDYATSRAASTSYIKALLQRTARKTGLPLLKEGVARTPSSTWILHRRLRLRRL